MSTPTDRYGIEIPPARSDSEIIDFTLSLDTIAYANGDLLADSQEITGVMNHNGGTAVLESIVLCDKDDQTAYSMSVVFLQASGSLGTENSAPSAADTVSDDIIGIVPVATTDCVDVGGAKIYCVRNIGLLLKSASDSSSIYMGIIVGTGTPTHTASGIVGKLGIVRD